jgi:hypothetical protein
VGFPLAGKRRTRTQKTERDIVVDEPLSSDVERVCDLLARILDDVVLREVSTPHRGASTDT